MLAPALGTSDVHHFLSADQGNTLEAVDELPSLDELVRGISLTRWLMNSYMILSAVFLVSFAVFYRIRLAIGRRRKARRRMRRASNESCRPPSSRALQAALSTRAQGDEAKPLLNRTRKNCRWCSLPRLVMRIRGVLNYQPEDSCGYELPPISTCLILGLYFGLNTWYMVYDVPWDSLKIFFVADRTGVVFTMNMPLLYLTVAKNPLIKVLTGWSYERLNIFHRAVGRLCMVAGIFHCAGSYWVWYTISVCI